MQVQDVYFNFTSSINSEVTRKRYEYCISKFLEYCNLDLEHLLELEQQELSNLIIKYLASQLYARIKKEGEPTAPDDDHFSSCHECGNTVPIYTARYESEIKDSLEVVQDPFESGRISFPKY